VPLPVTSHPPPLLRGGLRRVLSVGAAAVGLPPWVPGWVVGTKNPRRQCTTKRRLAQIGWRVANGSAAPQCRNSSLLPHSCCSLPTGLLPARTNPRAPPPSPITWPAPHHPGPGQQPIE
jgi:hypothetical protein